MLINNSDGKYNVLEDDKRHPVSFDKETADTVLAKIGDALSDIERTMLNLYRKDPVLYQFLSRNVFEPAGLACAFGSMQEIENASGAVKWLSKIFATYDDIVPTYEDTLNLDDINFKLVAKDPAMWEKIIEDTEERQVTEEIILLEDGSITRRNREITWEKVPNGRLSKSIKYTDLPVDDKISGIVERTSPDGDGYLPW